MTGVLELHGVTAGYSRDIDILQDLSLTVSATGITGLIGLNGAGKSTVTKVIAGLLHPRQGRITFGGNDITRMSPHRMIDHGIWLIPQESSLFPYMSIDDNLSLPLDHLHRRTGRPTSEEMAERFFEIHQRFPILREKRRSQVSDLSGGQQKMVELAKAYLIRPRLCLIDEPTVGLSPKIAEEVYQTITVFASAGSAILLIDHNIRKVVEMADMIYVLTLGHVSDQGAGTAFQANLHEHVRKWLGIRL